MPETTAAKEQPTSINNRPSGYDTGNFLMPQAMESIMRMHGEIFGACMTCNREVLDFLKGRFDEDKKLVATVTASEEARQIVDAYVDFWRKASIDYAGEASKLVNMNSEMANETLKHFNEDTSAVSQNFAKAA